MPSYPCFLAEVGEPLFGNVWLALLLVLALVTAFMIAVAQLGRWLEKGHPAPPAAPPPSVPTQEIAPSPEGSSEIPGEIMAVIAAAVATIEGENVLITSVKRPAVSVEAIMQQWSLEGRRQIYSSHRVR